MIIMNDSDVTIIDGFCGAGGSSLGCEVAGARVKLAMNHNELSLGTHARNFPHADHAKIDISQEDPKKYPNATVLWMSPECTNHSTSKGIKLLNQNQPSLWTDRDDDPFVERSRSTMWDVVRWTSAKVDQGHLFQLVFVENVVQVTLWRDYDAWLKAMHTLGYRHQVVCYNSMFSPALPAPVPQSRDRIYIVFSRSANATPDLDLRPDAHCAHCDEDVQAVQAWTNPAKKRGLYKKQYVYRCPVCAREIVPHFASAATLIDWDIPAPKIHNRARPLKEVTLKRIQTGIDRYCKEQPVPLLIQTAHTTTESNYSRPVSNPIFTQTTAQTVGIAVPPGFILSYYGSAGYKQFSEPLGTCTSRDRHAVVTFPDTYPQVEDCGFRMLNLNEVKKAMGFPASYEIVCSSQREGVRQCGLAVTPGVAAILVSRGIASLGYEQKGIA